MNFVYVRLVFVLFCLFCSYFYFAYGIMCSGYPISVSGVITVPVTASMYHTMVANIQHLHTNSDGTVCVTPVVPVPKVSVNVNRRLSGFLCSTCLF